MVIREVVVGTSNGPWLNQAMEGDDSSSTKDADIVVRGPEAEAGVVDDLINVVHHATAVCVRRADANTPSISSIPSGRQQNISL